MLDYKGVDKKKQIMEIIHNLVEEGVGYKFCMYGNIILEETVLRNSINSESAVRIY